MRLMPQARNRPLISIIGRIVAAAALAMLSVNAVAQQAMLPFRDWPVKPTPAIDLTFRITNSIDDAIYSFNANGVIEFNEVPALVLGDQQDPVLDRLPLSRIERADKMTSLLYRRVMPASIRAIALPAVATTALQPDAIDLIEPLSEAPASLQSPELRAPRGVPEPTVPAIILAMAVACGLYFSRQRRTVPSRLPEARVLPFGE